MLNFCVGLAFIILMVSIHRRSFEVKGWIGIGLFIAMCYGLGYTIIEIANMTRTLLGKE